MNHPHIFGCASEDTAHVAFSALVTSSPEVVTKVYLKANPSHRFSPVRSGSISGENLGSDPQASQGSFDSHPSGHGQIQPGNVPAISSAAHGDFDANFHTWPEIAARNQRLHIEGYE